MKLCNYVERTEAAFNNVQEGDLFHEMYTFYVYVVHVSPLSIITREGSAPCTFPDEAELCVYSSIKDFKNKFSYKSIKGYWVYYLSGGHNVKGWL